jgi:DNA-binding MarR family transcriptional regulator
MKKIKLELTQAQFLALIDSIDSYSAMRGTGSDFDIEANKNVRLIDRMLKNNGYKRNFK